MNEVIKWTKEEKKKPNKRRSIGSKSQNSLSEFVKHSTTSTFEIYGPHKKYIICKIYSSICSWTLLQLLQTDQNVKAIKVYGTSAPYIFLRGEKNYTLSQIWWTKPALLCFTSRHEQKQLRVVHIPPSSTSRTHFPKAENLHRQSKRLSGFIQIYMF